MKRVNKILFLIGFFLSLVMNAQEPLKLSSKEFMSIVKTYHPLAYRYRLENQIAEQQVTAARGSLDPVLSGKLGEKDIKGIPYYNQKGIELEIPTWYGIDFNAGYNSMEGQKIDNSDTRGSLYQYGVTIPLAKNLLYDKRRAVIEQAKYAVKMTKAEQLLLTNDLFLEAENTYWEWVKNYEIYQIQSKAVQLNRDRLQLIQKSLEYGERPAIDVVEVTAQLQSFEIQEKEAYLNFVKSTQDLQMFLWKENQQLYELSQVILPADQLKDHNGYGDFEFLFSKVSENPLQRHAAFELYVQKNNILDSERRLKFQSLLPKIDFSYQVLSTEKYNTDILPFFNNNFQYGLKLEIPLFLRQARADYQSAKLKLLQNKMDMEVKNNELRTKVETYRNEILNYNAQINLADQNIGNYKKLLTAEETRYENGESSLFLINSRENKLIEAQEKLLQLKAKFLKSYNKLKWFNEGFVRP